MEKNYLPIAIDISNSKILIIGGGQSALKKIRILQRSGANIEVVAGNIVDEVYASGVICHLKKYEKSDLNGYLMLYSCTNNETLDKQIAEDGKEAGVLVNVHDNPTLCQFVSPAIYRDGNLSVAVNSNAENVYEAIRVRNLIQEYLENLKNTQI
ncbi:siroheme synthase [Aquipluma nitroreducens]|uniref:precorrin-2 dehydrogenase n=1 Tax=Aquipluma nitroreducens TaxID=2010828 RepID=A0A5K7S3G2_9BACT|nr:NAD(P)-dependent oxidoreductase [Aquipluma nitroreducens]BBE15884.1 siroheme synthase [Aquipluma nitroreducens]